ncbi:DUF1275 family protein [Actinomycetospora soli]|uniref:DUF1275 family protein n=1 Tax=Actinomycetospora soli TaxID=2893887 RepID=UPI001E34FCC4|nr:DUF1275 family protein [Actinomycetospora soli]MCD2189583.1 DUF1275 family protein [Actinomycetospora soli]
MVARAEWDGALTRGPVHGPLPTVLTMTITGLGADVRRQGARVLTRRLLAVATMLVGALVGALLVLTVGPAWALVPVLLAGLVVVGVLGVHERRPPAAWQASR